MLEAKATFTARGLTSFFAPVRAFYMAGGGRGRRAKDAEPRWKGVGDGLYNICKV